MKLLRGPEALPAFRLARLERRLAAILGQPVSLTCHSFYLLETDALPPGRAGERLLRLLDARPWEQPGANVTNGGALYVVPRAGTVSPWSSKATDLLERCGFGALGRVERGTVITARNAALGELPDAARQLLHDRMTQTLVTDLGAVSHWFETPPPRPLGRIALAEDAVQALQQANQALGLALSADEIDYLAESYQRMGRDPTDAELVMFAQANSEHCRHKIFNASWEIDGVAREHSLFGMIRHTHKTHPQGVLSAYHDNAAVLEGFSGQVLRLDDHHAWREDTGDIHAQIKVETHNHPTAISPFPGAATGAGGEIRDEAATGRGARSVAGLTGFTVSDLSLPGYARPWEIGPAPPARLATALQIMLDGPIGAAAFNNEFGRPALGGYMRTFTAPLSSDNGQQRWYGYHKPIMIAGGSGTITGGQIDKQTLRAGDRVIVLGGPAMLIGLGGGAASSMAAGTSSEDLDYASVQRGNPEMQRRAQEVIDRCWSQGENNPIRSIHDVGAGGLSNAIPELLHDGGVGGTLELREIPSADPALAPVEIWCCEAQERYVLAIAPEDLERFDALCTRERCPYAVLGQATDAGHLRLDDRLLGEPPVDMPLDVLLGKPPQMHRQVVSGQAAAAEQAHADIDLAEAIWRVLRVPAVASKQYLITIGDRTVGALTARDQMVGPWQVPVADYALTLADYSGYKGTAMAMGERTPLAVYDAPASGRMAVGEALTNLAGAPVGEMARLRLSANWMAAAGQDGQDAALYETVRAVGLELCPALGVAIPVGKDSLSMRTAWNNEHGPQSMIAPVSLIVTAFATIPDVRAAVTPELKQSDQASRLLLIGFCGGQLRLGGSALSYAFRRELGPVPDLDDPGQFRAAFDTVQDLLDQGRILACHDRSDGGLFVTLLEMALAGHCGLDIELTVDDNRLLPCLFAEELGLVVQVAESQFGEVMAAMHGAGLQACVHELGRPAEHGDFVIRAGGRTVFAAPMSALEQTWSETSHAMARLRDDPECADEEYNRLADWSRPGLAPEIVFDLADSPAAPYVSTGARPEVAVLREQGVNGQREMAVAFMRAGFNAVDVHMSDLESGRATLERFQGLAFCGGFSFGDVLGAGQGWARSILFNPALRDAFSGFLADPGRFALGVCNGCQALSTLRDIVPGAEEWPRFVANRSSQFEARLSMVRIEPSPSLFFRGMEGSRIPVVTSHGEGRADFGGASPDNARVAVRFIDGDGRPAQAYPDNPNGSPAGITGLTNRDGRVTIMMPHPERLLRAVNFSWAPDEWGDKSPWVRMFENARAWVE